MGPAAAAAPMYMDELVEEFLLRLPPDDPASLVRAALVCRRWCRVLADPGFRRRFAELHRTAPLLGFLHRRRKHATCFAATAAFRPRDAGLLRDRHVFDARHGRVLLATLPLRYLTISKLSIWDPVTGERVELPDPPPQPHLFSWNATVLCAAAGSACDHLDCHRGPCLVVLVGATLESRLVFVCVYSSESGGWSQPSYAAQLHDGQRIYLRHFEHTALVGNALYSTFHKGSEIGILRCDLGTRELSRISPPPSCLHYGHRVVLTATENGGLGLARVENSRLYLWSLLEPGLSGHSAWAQVRAIELKAMLPADARLISSPLLGSARGSDVFFVRTTDGFFSVDLKAGVGRKVCKDKGISTVVPYMAFCTPALGAASTGE